MKQYPRQKEKALNLRKQNPHTIRKPASKHPTLTETPQFSKSKCTKFNETDASEKQKASKPQEAEFPTHHKTHQQACNFKSNPHSFKSKIKNQHKQIHYKTKSRNRIPNPSENPQASTHL